MKGTHVKMKSMIDVIKGHEISVKLSSPAPFQIDGETIEGIQEYTVHSAKAAVMI